MLRGFAPLPGLRFLLRCELEEGRFSRLIDVLNGDDRPRLDFCPEAVSRLHQPPASTPFCFLFRFFYFDKSAFRGRWGSTFFSDVSASTIFLPFRPVFFLESRSEKPKGLPPFFQDIVLLSFNRRRPLFTVFTSLPSRDPPPRTV